MKCGYTPLYGESANTLASMKSNMMQGYLNENDHGATRWVAIRDGLRPCPFVAVWHGNIEWNVFSPPPKRIRVARLTVNQKSNQDEAD